MNGAFIAHEIAERVKQPVKEPHIINLTLLPVTMPIASIWIIF